MNPAEFTKLFQIDPVLPRAVCIAQKAVTAHGPAFKDGIAAVFTLFDPTTEAPSGQSLFVAMNQRAAMTLARLILNHAKEQGWPDLGDVVLTRTEIPSSDKLS